jgi:hypothetical protein
MTLATCVAAGRLLGALAGCSSRNFDSGAGSEGTAFEPGDTVGVMLPTGTFENVTVHETYWNEALETAGLEADTTYAANSNRVADREPSLISQSSTDSLTSL